MTLSRLHLTSYGLAIGALGQGILYRSVLSQKSEWIVPFLVFPPWLIIYTITFCKVPPPFGPRRFRQCLMFAMCWYAGTLLLVEVLCVLVGVQPRTGMPIDLARMLAYAAIVTYAVFVKTCIEVRRFERQNKHRLREGDA